MSRPTFHDRTWRHRTGVTTGDRLTRGERPADHMKAVLATWTALIGMGASVPVDPAQPVPVDLGRLTVFVLLIANRRGEQVAAELSQHTESNTEAIQALLADNTATTNAIHELTREVHDAVAMLCSACGAPLKPGHHLVACPTARFSSIARRRRPSVYANQGVEPPMVTWPRSVINST